MNARDFLFHPDVSVVRRMQVLVVVGALTFAAGLWLTPERIWMNLLLVSYYLIGLALAGTVFIAFQYVTGANWSVALRRVPEAMATLLPVSAIGILAILSFRPSLYAWTQDSHLTGFRHLWLNLGFFRARALIYVLAWLAFTLALLRASRAQDESGDLRYTRRNTILSPLFLVVFAITFWLASYDWIMSLEPEWYSTIFGMYNFAGLFLSGLAAMTVALVWLREHSALKHVINSHHLHDMGKLMFAFSTFWMYLWFSQYMLIWYANVPEETVYFIRRQHGFWAPLFLLNIVLNWVIPFFALMPRLNKQRPGLLFRVALVLLAGRWLDLYLMIAPPFSAAKPTVGVWEVGLMAGAVAVFVLGLFSALRRAPLVPVKDPFLADSLHYHA